MRSRTDATKIRKLMEALGAAATGPGTVYLTGGASAVLEGWRDTTIDVDLKADPEPPGLFEAIARLKNELDMNVELASPDDFIPPLPEWRERSPSITAAGPVRFHHYDFYAQALSKVERGHTQDLRDAREMVERGFVQPTRLWKLWEEIRPALIRYPAIDPDAFREKVEAFLAEVARA